MPHETKISQEKQNNGTEDEDDDPVTLAIKKTGCLHLHYAVQDCMFEHKDWRKCQTEVSTFRQCIADAKGRNKVEGRIGDRH